MASNIGKLQLNRGTDIERVALLLADGEPFYTTDTKKYYIGDGLTYGGNLMFDVSSVTGTLFSQDNITIPAGQSVTIDHSQGSLPSSVQIELKTPVQVNQYIDGFDTHTKTNVEKKGSVYCLEEGSTLVKPIYSIDNIDSGTPGNSTFEFNYLQSIQNSYKDLMGKYNYVYSTDTNSLQNTTETLTGYTTSYPMFSTNGEFFIVYGFQQENDYFTRSKYVDLNILDKDGNLIHEIYSDEFMTYDGINSQQVSTQHMFQFTTSTSTIQYNTIFGSMVFDIVGDKLYMINMGVLKCEYIEYDLSTKELVKKIEDFHLQLDNYRAISGIKVLDSGEMLISYTNYNNEGVILRFSSSVTFVEVILSNISSYTNNSMTYFNDLSIGTVFGHGKTVGIIYNDFSTEIIFTTTSTTSGIQVYSFENSGTYYVFSRQYSTSTITSTGLRCHTSTGASFSQLFDYTANNYSSGNIFSPMFHYVDTNLYFEFWDNSSNTSNTGFYIHRFNLDAGTGVQIEASHEGENPTQTDIADGGRFVPLCPPRYGFTTSGSLDGNNLIDVTGWTKLTGLTVSGNDVGETLQIQFLGNTYTNDLSGYTTPLDFDSTLFDNVKDVSAVCSIDIAGETSGTWRLQLNDQNEYDVIMAEVTFDTSDTITARKIAAAINQFVGQEVHVYGVVRAEIDDVTDTKINIYLDDRAGATPNSSWLIDNTLGTGGGTIVQPAGGRDSIIRVAQAQSGNKSIAYNILFSTSVTTISPKARSITFSYDSETNFEYSSGSASSVKYDVGKQSIRLLNLTKGELNVRLNLHF